MTAPNDGTSHDVTASLSGLVAGYGTSEVLGPVNLTLRPGVTALLGRNGSGKTTLMRTLCGVIPPLRGTCTVLGETVADGAAVRTRVGYLGHRSALAGALTVRENLRFWEDLSGIVPQATVIPADQLVARFELAEILSRKVSSLSRGQRQRVDLARLAMTDPEFVVLDEPLTGLDPVHAARTRALLADWGTRRTLLYSTHSIPEALELADRFVVVVGRRLVEVGPRTDHTPAAVTEATLLDVLEATA